MLRFLIDENMPRSTARLLEHAGYIARDVRDIGYNATPDSEIFQFAQSIGAAIITRDIGFGSILDYPLGTHAGIVVLRIPTHITTNQLNSMLLGTIEDFADDISAGSLVIIESGRTRIRSPGR